MATPERKGWRVMRRMAGDAQDAAGGLGGGEEPLAADGGRARSGDAGGGEHERHGHEHERDRPEPLDRPPERDGLRRRVGAGEPDEADE